MIWSQLYLKTNPLLRKTSVLIAILVLLSLAALAVPTVAPLLIGDRVPPLEPDVKWIKGEPVLEFKPGQVYILDLWGTWCAPCLADLPHMNAIAKKYRERGVTLVAVAIDPGAAFPPSEFVRRKGDQMDFVVGEEINGRMESRFKDALGNIRFPTIAIIDRQGRLAWMGQGYPIYGFDAALEQIVAGKYDMEAAVKESQRRHAIKLKALPLVKPLEERWDAGNYKEALPIVRQLVALDPGMFGMEAYSAFLKMQRQASKDEAFAFAQEVVDKLLTANDPDLAWPLSSLAQSLTYVPTRQGPTLKSPIEPRELELAFKAAQRANALLGGKEPWRLEILAMVYYAKGDLKQALTFISDAVKQAEEQHWGTEELEKLRKRLSLYQEVASRNEKK